MAAEDTGMYTEDDGVLEIWDVTNLAVARQHLP
jgi:hypothetical protein